jgi:microcystin-dependent protein
MMPAVVPGSRPGLSYRDRRSLFDSMVGTIAPWPGHPKRVPRGWLLCNGQTVLREQYPALARKLIGKRYPISLTIDEPNGKVNYIDPGLTALPHAIGDRIVFIQGLGGTLPPEIAAGSAWYVVAYSGAGLIFATTPGGTGQSISGSWGGTLYIVFAPWQAAGSTTQQLTIPNMKGRVPMGRSMMPKTAAAVDRFSVNSPVAEHVLGWGHGDSTTGEGAPAPVSPSHIHTHVHYHTPSGGGVFRNNVGGGTNWAQTAGGTNSGFDATTAGPNVGTTSAVGGAVQHNNMQPSIVANYIIFTGVM